MLKVLSFSLIKVNPKHITDQCTPLRSNMIIVRGRHGTWIDAIKMDALIANSTGSISLVNGV